MRRLTLLFASIACAGAIAIPGSELRPGQRFLERIVSLPVARAEDRALAKQGLTALARGDWRAAFAACQELETAYGALLIRGQGAGTIVIRPSGGGKDDIPLMDRREVLSEFATLRLYLLDLDGAIRDLTPAPGADDDLAMMRISALARKGRYQEAIDLLKTARLYSVVGGWSVRESDVLPLVEVYQLAAANQMEDQVRLHEIAMAMGKGTGLLPDPRGADFPSSLVQREATLVLAELSIRGENPPLARSYLQYILRDKSPEGVFHRRLANARMSQLVKAKS